MLEIASPRTHTDVSWFKYLSLQTFVNIEYNVDWYIGQPLKAWRLCFLKADLSECLCIKSHLHSKFKVSSLDNFRKQSNCMLIMIKIFIFKISFKSNFKRIHDDSGILEGFDSSEFYGRRFYNMHMYILEVL